jgi:tRNA A37 threonylcarbamoyladenosine modification protein TsaB
MWLFIESVQSDMFRIGFLGADGSRVKTVSRRANFILPELSRLAGTKGLKKIQGVCVVEGPGAFTPVRTAVLVANLLARFLKKPLVGITTPLAQDLKKLSATLECGSLCPADYVAPRYESEPNIILAKNP